MMLRPSRLRSGKLATQPARSIELSMEQSGTSRFARYCTICKPKKGLVMRSTILAGLVLLSATAAFAQNTEMAAEMATGISMLETSVERALKQYGLEADIMSLTLSQLVEIRGVISENSSDSDTKASLQAALQ
jgi:hypothetical protein